MPSAVPTVHPPVSSLPSADIQIPNSDFNPFATLCSHGLGQTWNRHFMNLNVVSAWLLSRQSLSPHLPSLPSPARQDPAQYILSLTTPDFSAKGTRKPRFCQACIYVSPNTYGQKPRKALFSTVNILTNIVQLFFNVSVLMLAIIRCRICCRHFAIQKHKTQYIQNCNFACFVWV